ncbi:hypothetical protein DM47_3526 [Burkholderia mallei]|uniref:Uncharacterized protein n=1 Tax=Burkholderia pseudomallei 1710a TaxID=320371 RepID=A0A0E1W6N7_BURPE|nr:hypothetical protein BURPS1710A_0169 [Burkholderia pseudomallei 1710a]KGC58221.1 hypothetical protein DM75_3557 [Burkholderia mallei]KOT20064.1 hypothetical protein DM47_3526 [Burkholderia mallei]KOT22878.1 hypothetical protein DM52_2664 [Burkholderia mallei]
MTTHAASDETRTQHAAARINRCIAILLIVDAGQANGRTAQAGIEMTFVSGLFVTVC